MPELSAKSSRAAYKRMEKRWVLLNDLLGGTVAMREAGQRWLPKEPKEKGASYTARLGRSVLLPGYRDTIDDLSDLPFSKRVTLTDQPIDFENDVDMNGTSLTSFAKSAMRSALIYGMVHIFVDGTRLPEGATKADDSKIRPFFILVNAPDLIDWKFVNGELVEASFRETIETDDGTEKWRIRRWTKTDFAIYEETEHGSDKYTLTKSGTHTFNRVPMVTCYFTKIGLLEADPPLESLAFTNLAHWQSYSEHRNILRFARLGILTATGMQKSEIDLLKSDGVAPGTVFYSTNPEARINYCEYSGSGAMEIGFKDLEMLRSEMESQGLAPLVSKGSQDRATPAIIDESKNKSSMQSWIQELEIAIFSAYNVAAAWLEVDVLPTFKVDIYDEFVIPMNAFNDLTTLLTLRRDREISHETLFAELRRRSFIAETSDSKKEQEQLTKESAVFGLGPGSVDSKTKGGGTP